HGARSPFGLRLSVGIAITLPTEQRLRPHYRPAVFALLHDLRRLPGLDVALLYAEDVDDALEVFAPAPLDQRRRALHAALVGRDRETEHAAEIVAIRRVVPHRHGDGRALGIVEHNCAVDGHDRCSFRQTFIGLGTPLRSARRARLLRSAACEPG